jgi:hypothetical protein
VATFVQWVNAERSKDEALADFYRDRFRKEFRPAFAAWEATRPAENPDAPLTPFAMPEYGWPPGTFAPLRDAGVQSYSC